MPKERVSISLEKDTLKNADSIVDKKIYRNRSQVIELAIDDFVKKVKKE